MTKSTGILAYLNEQKKQREQTGNRSGKPVSVLANDTLAKLKHHLKSPSAE
jgi:dihydroorotate dehydrogenase